MLMSQLRLQAPGGLWSVGRLPLEPLSRHFQRFTVALNQGEVGSSLVQALIQRIDEIEINLRLELGRQCPWVVKRLDDRFKRVESHAWGVTFFRSPTIRRLGGDFDWAKDQMDGLLDKSGKCRLLRLEPKLDYGDCLD